MAVPKLETLMQPCLSYASCHTQCSKQDLIEFCSDVLHLTEEEKAETVKSGRTKLYIRVSWAIKYLRMAGLLESIKRGVYTITSEGKNVIEKGCSIDLAFLNRYPSFYAFRYSSPQKDQPSAEEFPLEQSHDPQTPQEMIDEAVQQLHASLSDDLLREIGKISPYDFEHLVVRLLIKMGYGDLSQNQDAVTKKSGDEGIDGVVTSDEFGFDSVYIQAKKWKSDSVVGRPEIMKFMGALAGQGATKGLFITTTKFSAEAIEYASKQLQHKIVLVDGKRLTELMIKFNLGVSVEDVIEIKKIDTDFFESEI